MPPPIAALTEVVRPELATPGREAASPPDASGPVSRSSDPDLAMRMRRAPEEDPAVHEESATARETSVGERIAERAYFLYLARHGEGGDALGDWLEAERQIGREQPIHS
jgi:hypothetical protein